MDYLSFGIRVKKERLKLKLTQAQLAEKVGVTTAYIGQLERGERKLSVETLVKLCNAFNITSDYLLFESLTNSATSITHEVSRLLSTRNQADTFFAVELLQLVLELLDKHKK